MSHNLGTCSGGLTFFYPRLYWRRTVPRRIQYAHTPSYKLDDRTTSMLNETSTHLEDIVDHILAEFCVDCLGLLLVRSLMDSIGLVTYVVS